MTNDRLETMLVCISVWIFVWIVAACPAWGFGLGWMIFGFKMIMLGVIALGIWVFMVWSVCRRG